MELLQRLISLQDELDLSDRAFAARLGVNHALWNQTRLGKMTLNDTVLAGVLRAFPDLEEQVMEYKLAILRSKMPSQQGAVA